MRLQSVAFGATLIFLANFAAPACIAADPAAVTSGALLGQLVVYTPPGDVGTPNRTAGGGTRGAHKKISVNVIAPSHPAITISSQPTLYWYISDAWPHDVVVTLVDDDANAIVSERLVDSPTRAGFQPLSLSGLDAHLQPGKTYHWSVALVGGPSDALGNSFAGASIKLRPVAAASHTDGNASDATQKAQSFAQNGIWYDTVDILSRAIAHSPTDKRLRIARSGLLRQIGLDDAATHDAAIAARE